MRVAVHVVLVALLGTACAVPSLFAQGLILEDEGSNRGQKIRMHEPAFNFQDTRSREVDTESTFRSSSPTEDSFRPEPAYNPETPPEVYQPYRPPVERVPRTRKQRNWILPPPPDELRTREDIEREEDVQEEGDFRAEVRAIYQRAYTRSDDEDTASESGEEGGRDGQAAPARSYDPDNAMGLLLPESGSALSPVIGLLGDDSSAGDDSARAEPDALGAVVEDLYGASDASIFGERDLEDEFGTDMLSLGGVDTAGDGAVSPDDGSGLAMTRSLLANIGRGGPAGADEGSTSVDFAPTQVRSEGLGHWRTALSSTAAALQPRETRGDSSADAFAPRDAMRAGTDARLVDTSVIGGLTGSGRQDSILRPSSTWIDGSLVGRDSGSGLGALPRTSSRSFDGGTIGGTIGGFGGRGGSSFGSSAISTPSTGSRSSISSLGSGTSYGTGTRGGVKATDDIPNPLGGSLFD